VKYLVSDIVDLVLGRLVDLCLLVDKLFVFLQRLMIPERLALFLLDHPRVLVVDIVLIQLRDKVVFHQE
jgi:hypothetical protein